MTDNRIIEAGAAEFNPVNEFRSSQYRVVIPDNMEETVSEEALPQHIVELILQKLPMISLVRFMVVCRKWNEFIKSSSFFLESRTREHVPLLYNAGLEMIFYSRKKGWTESTDLWMDYTRLESIVVGGGLFCFYDEEDLTGSGFRVVNPVTKRWRHVPMPLQGGPFYSDIIRVTILGSDNRDFFKLVVIRVGKAGDWSKRPTLVYDSRSCSWHTGKAVPPGCKFYPRDSKGITSGGNVYWIARAFGVTTTLLRYNVDDDSWAHAGIHGYFPSQTVDLIEHRGRLLIMTLVHDLGDDLKPRPGWMYEIEDMGEEVKTIKTQLPKTLVNRMCEIVRGHETIWFSGLGDYTYVISRPSGTGSGWKEARVLCLDLTNGSAEYLKGGFPKHMMGTDAFWLFEPSLTPV